MRELKHKLWPYKVRIDSDNLRDITPIETWLGEEYGVFKGRWNVIYRYNCTDFYFKLGDDAVFFKLKWS